MFLSEIRLKNFRCFDENEHSIRFHSGLNVLVGENDSGKSAVVDAIRIVLGTTDQGWYRIDATDFYNEDKSREITIICRFENLSDEECAAFLECLTYEKQVDEMKPCLYLYWNCKYLLNFIPARVSVTVSTGLNGDGPSPSAEARELIRVTYLRALRDAYTDMQAGRNSRLSQIVQRVPELSKGESEYVEGMDLSKLSIVGIADLSNKLLMGHSALNKTNQDITSILHDRMLLHGDELKTQLQVAGADVLESKKLISLLEKLDLAAISNGNQSQGHVGLGTSNILSMACELLLNDINEKSERSTFLLIEEPEAHLHAQRQLRLIQSLQDEASSGSNQIIITTHSPLLASVVDLNNITIMNKSTPFSLAKEQTLLEDDDYSYLSRYLDATKANLFFARGVLIVEGPAEELLLPTIAKIIKRDFSKYGVSVVNVRGTGLRRFARVFQRKDDTTTIPIPVACVTDRDILPDCAPAICFDPTYTSIEKYPQKRKWKTESEFTADEKEAYIKEIREKADGQNVKTFVSEHWTLEYDMFFCGLNNEMLQALVEVEYVKENQKKKLIEIQKAIDSFSQAEEKASYFYSFFQSKQVSKAEFAQNLASILLKNYFDKPELLLSQLPTYIRDAIYHVTEK
jgi:putative ATP-dependent endonuclease of OLD family